MFTFEKYITTSNFFVCQQGIGFVKNHPEISVCLVAFDKSYYRDTLFTHFSLPFPNMLESAVTKRKAEYLAGRYAAGLLLKKVGCNGAVVTGTDRAPIWPTGWQGSISHTDTWAVAILTQYCSGIRLGVDIETFRPELIREIATNFTTDDERDVLIASGIPFETTLLIYFSAKESLFKALYPLVHHKFDFETAKLCELDSYNQSFTMKLTRQLASSLRTGYRITGHYMISQDGVTTMIVALV
ncbi:4'-phosphopantetheinyl transferase family protein [Escherichia coli]|uniref:4'-phosphopantetheinyl transferase family protein n=1 Tax=Escherichia coli TaxID=562 RepID=UPI000B429A3C|nr:4'-phosphopantetheinyl transferase superfamily protein [Escherichia coli]OWC42001.1 4-phosphopantetheinyl transferase [Escherichia coli]RCP65677.1 4-phosphopantetheinyl transferase [Escherichia coli]HAH2770906.1 4-phosphopantetheinyl transferase [Escherichia coli]HAM4607117.1 4'-phosphopantetheinyl transferase superfamily protein [Escherichia coli]